ncbi:hypothetical protein P3102_22625 [Amycolatopsis sp. QT-25]|uniref:hypothetical protein n=1 Tax=Amycolatopsis sp. QT-25 TaxID=3034022 RepID=UPI0023EBCB27|nr:hypothetical protein [Amycolatopsis sp. QT-25]WET76901.1 hypothetical protein P3102_22625 [Amycolatopsis sp. QT-25]
MADDPVFWLGPLSLLRALPSPALGSGPHATPVRVGGTHRTLNGTPTVDVLGRKRTWVLSWPYLDAETFAFLDAIDAGTLADTPLWLIDPARPNRLPEQTASGGSARRSTVSFTPVGSTDLSYLAGTVPTGVGLPLGGGLRFMRPQNGGQIITGDRPPVLAGETVTFSAWCRGLAPVAVFVTFTSATGTALGTVESPSISLGGRWTQVAVTATAPDTSGPAVTCAVGVNTTSPLPPSYVFTTGWQLESATEPGPFAIGGGAAVVVIESLKVSYPLPGSYAAELTLLEV